MAAVKSKNTSLERAVFSALRKRKIHFQRHYKKAPGSPDIAFPTKKIAVFIDGDFWHGYRYPVWKRTIKSSFWRNKIEKNRKRDKRNFRKLRAKGWVVIRIWEHDVKNDLIKAVDRICHCVKLPKRIIIKP